MPLVGQTGRNRTSLTPGGGCLSRVIFHNPSDEAEPVLDMPPVTRPGLAESLTGAAESLTGAAVVVFAGTDDSDFVSSFLVSGEELFEAGRFLGAL